MPLNWNAEDIDDDVWNDTDSSVREAMIFATMSLGINEIKESNLDDWCDRAKVHRALRGGIVWTTREDGSEYHYLEDREFMSQYIGLHTNASRFSAVDHLKYILRDLKRDRDWMRKRQAEKAAEA